MVAGAKGQCPESQVEAVSHSELAMAMALPDARCNVVDPSGPGKSHFHKACGWEWMLLLCGEGPYVQLCTGLLFKVFTVHSYAAL